MMMIIPIVVTLVGIVLVFKFEHHAKALPLILVTDEGIVTDDTNGLDINKPWLMVVIDDGIVSDVNPAHA